jgi:hypothetical protein
VLVGCALLGLSLCAPSRAAAFDLPLPGRSRILSVTLTQALIGEYHADDDALTGNPGEKYFDFKNRTDLVLLHGSTSFNLRFDANAFIGTNDGSLHQNRISLEKITLSSVQRRFDVTAGDYYVRVGRGLALDITRVDQLVRDTSLRGGLARVRSRWVDGLLFGGWANPLDVDDFSEVPVRIPSDVIGGARLEVRPRESLTLGLHYAGGGLQPQSGMSRNATHVLGGSVELPNVAERINLYAEFDYLSRAQGLEIIHGHGTYLSAAGTFGPFSALAEFKFYNHFQFRNDLGNEVSIFEYHRPPTLMRQKAEVLNNHDVIGPRVKLDLRLGSFGTVVFGNFGYFFVSDAGSKEDFFANGVTVFDVWGGIQQPLPGGALDLGGGWRRDAHDKDGEKKIDYSETFFEGELSFQILRRQTIELEVRYRKLEKVGTAFSHFYVGAGYRPSRYFSGGFSYEYSSEHSSKDTNPNDEIGARSHFGGVRATVNFNPSSFARIFGGTTAGGVRCIDGFCRDFPPFIGVKMEVVVQL